MSEAWRLLETGFNNAFANMAIDRAILVSNSKGHVPPTVRFYGWQPSAISIGYFQSLKDEVDIDICDKLGVDYVRRITGGGAVFHENELTYSIVLSESHPSITKNILDSYGRICGGIIKGLNILGIDADYIPINDIVSNGKKISGNAQTRKFKTLLQHGTILMDVDVEKMFSVLNVPNEKIKDKLISNVKERVTSIKHILGKDISFNIIEDSMKQGFEEEFNILLEEGELTNEELNEWKQHQFYTKSVAGKIYGKFSLDIAVLSYDKAPNYGYHGMRVIYIWSHGQFIRSAKSIYSNTTPESSKYVELDKLLPIEEPYIPSKSCGNRPNFYNNQFIRHPEPSKLHIKQWEERKASYK